MSMAQYTHTNDDETRHQPDDAIAMLTADHRQVRALFQQYADTAQNERTCHELQTNDFAV
jgi:hypothetical protein